MDETIKEMAKNYHENLRPDEYHKVMLHAMNEEKKSLGELFEISLSALHKLFKSGRFKGKKLLEIGSGATYHNIASASTQFTEIVQSDFVEANNQELRKVLRGESKLDWSVFLEVVAKLEGFQDLSAGQKEIDARIRKSVKSVVRCDVLSDQVIPPEVTTKYDLILVSLTLEAAATDVECYTQILKRLNNLLRSGGGLVMIGFLNGKKWKTEGGEFHHLEISQDEVDKALDNAGFINRDWNVQPKIENEMYEYENYYFVASTKI